MFFKGSHKLTSLSWKLINLIMNKITAIFIITFLLFTCNTITGQTGFKSLTDITEFKKKLLEATKTTKTIESDFVQEKKLSVLSKNIISKGHFCFKKENNVRWEYLQPYEYLIIIANNKFFIKDNDNKKEFDSQSNKVFKEMNTFISDCIQGNILNHEKDYKIDFFVNDRFYYVKLIPVEKKMRDILNEIQIYFDKKDLSVSKIKLLESEGDYTSIEFQNKKFNVDIASEKFSFK